MKRLLSAPTSVNLELTELCNVKCSHCYNFWRDESVGSTSLTLEKMDRLVEQFVTAGVFHVIVTGGEPFARFPLLRHALTRLQERGLSYSCNSNLTLATPEKVRALREIGLDHILTSLPSMDPDTNDQIMNSHGAYEKILRGIRTCVSDGIRVSVNMVVTRRNMDQVYETARLVADLGAQRIFVTRSVPPTYVDTQANDAFTLTPEEQLHALDEAIRARDDFGIGIGSLVSYPLCFLGDLVRYREFVGRGCPSQSGHRMSINANGDCHVCVHEEEGYGNIFDTPLAEIYQTRMRRWHDGSYHFDGCRGCPYLNICESGCSMSALGHSGNRAAKDPLFVGPHAFTHHFEMTQDEGVLAAIDAGLRFFAPKRLRFRRENGFHLINVRWANCFPIEDEIAEFLMRHRDSGESFSLLDIGTQHRRLLAHLLAKDAIEAPTYVSTLSDRARLGLSVNIDALPEFVR